MKVKLVTGAISTFIRKISEFLNDGSIFFSKEGHIFFEGRHYSGIRNITYEELKSLILNEELIAGQQYKITDYRTIYSHNLEGQDKTYGREGDSIECPIEPLIVTAISKNSLNPIAKSENFPNDIIHYTYESVKNYNKDSDNHKGTITYREDTTINCSSTEDWRNIQYPVYTYSPYIVDSIGYTSGMQMTRGQIIRRGEQLYISRINKTNNDVLSELELSLVLMKIDFSNFQQKEQLFKSMYKELKIYTSAFQYENRKIGTYDSDFLKYQGKNKYQETSHKLGINIIVVIPMHFSGYEKQLFPKINCKIKNYGGGLTRSIVIFNNHENNIKTDKSYIYASFNNNIFVTNSSLIVDKSYINQMNSCIGNVSCSNINFAADSFIRTNNSNFIYCYYSNLYLYNSQITYCLYGTADEKSSIRNSTIAFFDSVNIINSKISGVTCSINTSNFINCKEVTFDFHPAKKCFYNAWGSISCDNKFIYEDSACYISTNGKQAIMKLNFDTSKNPIISLLNNNGNYELQENIDNYYWTNGINKQ